MGGPTTATASEQSYREGTLVVDVFDAWTKQVLWRGVATDALPANPTSHAATTQKAIDTMFENLPTLPVDDKRGPLDIANGQGATTRFQSPRIIFSPAPALLVPIRGEPVYRDVAGSGLQRILNTPLLIVRNAVGVHYLKTFDGWMEAYTLTGSWSVAGTAPDGADAVLAEVGGGASQGLADTPHVSRDPAPAVYVSTTPAALIVTEGDPRFVPLDGTSLLYVSNTTAHVFKEPTDQELYVLVSSRWFRAWTINGPWEHVPDDELPSDIARLPRDVLQANM